MASLISTIEDRHVRSLQYPDLENRAFMQNTPYVFCSRTILPAIADLQREMLSELALTTPGRLDEINCRFEESILGSVPPLNSPPTLIQSRCLFPINRILSANSWLFNKFYFPSVRDLSNPQLCVGDRNGFA